MKKLTTLFALAALSAGAFAQSDFIVYENGQVNPDLIYYGWYNEAVDANATDPEDATRKALSFKAANGGADASFGYFIDHGVHANLCTGPLYSATLEFEWYGVSTGTYTVRLTALGGSEENYKFTLDESTAGKWNKISLPVATTFPTVSTQWKDFTGNGSGYPFGFILENGTPETIIYLKNIKYVNLDAEWVEPEVEKLPAPETVPTPATPAADVVNVFSTHYGAGPAFNIGGWGQSTTSQFVTIDGSEVDYMQYFNYLGWEFPTAINASACDYLHVDMFTPNATAFGFTPISLNPTMEKGWVTPEVKQKEWNSYDVPLTYFTEAGVDMSKIGQFKFDQGNSQWEVYVANVYFYDSKGAVSGIEEVEAAETPVYYNLHGIRVDNPEKGLYIRVCGGKAEKVIL